ncbi:Uncharacterised protein [Streptococcus gallolyticus]|uniref:Uncharacterized protein n=1 Tax=Streptococcus gallolyticus TaxID=315405 RepID=A0A380K8V7_9STRE|nr:Uncharacterised protein [Streptococcus gallolyticus]
MMADYLSHQKLMSKKEDKQTITRSLNRYEPILSALENEHDK